jgi:hypothetical protein
MHGIHGVTYLKTTFSQESRGEGEGKPPFVYNVTFFRYRIGSELVKGKREMGSSWIS